MKTISLKQEQIISDKNWIKYLTDRYSFIFFHPTYVKVPYASQFMNNKQTKKVVSQLENHLINTFPIYIGTNVHSEMTKLERALPKKTYRWYKDHNKLGINSWGTVAGISLLMLNMYLDKSYTSMENLPKNKNYSIKSFSEKLEFCLSLDKKLHTILERLYEDYS